MEQIDKKSRQYRTDYERNRYQKNKEKITQHIRDRRAAMSPEEREEANKKRRQKYDPVKRREYYLRKKASETKTPES